MLQYISLIGLLFIAAGWMAQYLSLSKGKKEIVQLLPALNILGIGILVVGAYLSNAVEVLVGNIITLLSTILVFIAFKK
jgi:hypothetical protein